MKKAVIILALVLSGMGQLMAADDELKPFILGHVSSDSLSEVHSEVAAKVTGAGFTIVGEYSPYADVEVIVMTNDELKSLASKSEYGGFGAMVRVALTRIDRQVQVSYTNPEYMFYGYRMKGKIDSVTQAVQEALGNEQQFGPDDGETPKKLRKYQYMMFMPKFDDVTEIAEYESQSQAIAAVEAGLAAKKGNTVKVYRIDIPGKEESVFGVGLTDESAAGSDLTVMTEIDFKPYRSTAHLPYELLVTEGKVIIFDGKFRIALNFPDLDMLGDHSFMNIVGAPGDIEESLTAAAGGK